MNYLTKFTVAPIITLALALSLTAGTAQAQSSEAVVGGLLGGTLGSVVGGKLDNKGSSSDGKVIGALVGGSLGYVIGDGLGHDDRLRSRHSSQSGSYYSHNGKPYRRYSDHEYGHVYVPITSQDNYYYSDGRSKHRSSYSSRKNYGKNYRVQRLKSNSRRNFYP